LFLLLSSHHYLLHGQSQAGVKDHAQKATEVQEQQVLKVLESANEQSREVAAQKTGVGKNLNITG